MQFLACFVMPVDVQFLACSVMPVVVPTPVEIPQVQFVVRWFVRVVQVPQVQFLDKVMDVPDGVQRRSRRCLAPSGGAAVAVH